MRKARWRLSRNHLSGRRAVVGGWAVLGVVGFETVASATSSTTVVRRTVVEEGALAPVSKPTNAGERLRDGC